MEDNKEIIESTETAGNTEIANAAETVDTTETVDAAATADNTEVVDATETVEAAEKEVITENVDATAETDNEDTPNNQTSISEIKEAMADEISSMETKDKADEIKSEEASAEKNKAEDNASENTAEDAASKGVNIRHLMDENAKAEGAEAKGTIFKKPTKDNKALKCADIEMLVDENGKSDNDTSLMDRLYNIREWVLENNRLVMPLVLVVCIVLTIVVALNASRREHLQKVANNAAQEANATAESTVDADTSIIYTPEVGLEENAYPEINQLVKTYYEAQADGDIDTISSLNTYLNDIELLRIKQLSSYIEKYDEINIYTKPGLADNTYVAYVCAYVKFYDNDTTLPGMQTYYISANEDGGYTINDGTYDDSIYEYIKTVTIQDDVVDLNNKIVVEYNDIIENSAVMADYLIYIKGMINEEVGEMLAEEESPANETIEPTETTNNAPVATIVSKVRAKERVNIRKSDSKEADKVGAASAGEEFKLLEKKDNGWTKIEYNGAEAYINSDYVEDVDAVTIELQDADSSTSPQPTSEATAAASPSPAAKETASSKPSPSPKANSETMSGKVKINASGVRVRAGAGTDSAVLGTVYVGATFNATGKDGDWVQIDYNGKTGYIKSDFVEKID